ncbi:LysM peptidoglycan-binding domain-containing protein [Actinocrinis puniceicyclus]|uniref:LysM peptidoglycan-binding domain-containing protein n=1 Tax=Actinocrinis puniceicyclus TaxID=977794 RepID=A0A8J7WTW2_9ACTN|nr:BTAD domain-containing putative transcriptional regulator [Actinocrinis puniceicyclus]MBS2965640.1 LysM peptidoglycan-binding domain-containing protein [Actinocrinis puniceicyclus]
MVRRRSYDSDVLWDVVIQPVLLVGLPVALWVLTGSPIPSRLPSWLDLQLWWAGVQMYPPQALDIVPRVVVDALWLGWAWYAAWFALGMAWALLRLPSVVMPHLLLHLTPRTAVQAITAGAVAATPVVHASPAHATASTAQLPANLDGRIHITTAPPASAPAHGHRPILPAKSALADTHTAIHRVQQGDTLWDLASHYYGDGEQWHRIYAANAGHTQPDGDRLTNPDLIRTGWHLAIPGAAVRPTDATATAHNPPTNATPETPTPLTPGAAAQPHATAPTAPTAPTAGNHAIGHAAGSKTADSRSAPRAPHSVGWHIPRGGYIGFTLLAAIAASVALLRTRHRRHPGSPALSIPDAVTALAAVHSAALAANACGYDPQEHPGQLPPPLPTANRGARILGTAGDQRHEIPLEAAGLRGLLYYSGPGAEDAARALIISILSSTDLAHGLGTRTVLIDRGLAQELLSTGGEEPLPGWLSVADTPEAAVEQFRAAAHRRATGQSSQSGDDRNSSGRRNPDTTLVLRACPELDEPVVEACILAPTGLDAVLLGRPETTHPAHQRAVTTISLDEDGAVQNVTGPHSPDIEHMTVHMLPRDLAADLYRVLRAARTPYPPQADDDHAGSDAGTPQHAATAVAAAAMRPAAPPEASLNTVPDALPEPDASTDRAARTAPQREDGPAQQPAPMDPLTLTRTPLLLRLLGPIDVLGPRGNTAPTGEKLHMLLTLLALHPAGHNAQHLANIGWAEIREEEQRRRAAYTTISRARAPFHTAHGTDPHEPGKYIVKDRGVFRLDPDQITTDLALFERFTHEAEHAVDTAERRDLLARAAALYRGPLADGVADDNRDWLTDARFELCERVVHLRLELADLTADDDAETAIAHLAAATALAPDDEETTSRAIRLYRQLGRPDLARAAYQQLVAALRELGEQPSDDYARLSAVPESAAA